MQQLVSHVSQETARFHALFPYTFGQFCPALAWVSNTTRGQRFMLRTFNPQAQRWAKTKESVVGDVVFMFHHPATGFVGEQIVQLAATPMDQIMHIVENYYVTPEQKLRIQDYLATVQTHGPIHTVWASHHVPGQAAYEVTPTETYWPQVLTAVDAATLQPPPDLSLRKPVGRPKLARNLEAELMKRDEGVVSLSALEKFRLSLHTDPEVRGQTKAERAVYYNMTEQHNPDNYSDEQLRNLMNAA